MAKDLKLYGRSKEVFGQVIEKFKSGKLPQILAPIFVNRNDDIPCQSWSFMNQMLAAMAGTADGRTFNAWRKVGRKVKKGSSAFYILKPCIANIEDKETGEKKTFLYGFGHQAEFKIEDTEVFDKKLWAKHSTEDKEEKERLKNLPLVDVAHFWGLDVTSFNGRGKRYLGYFSPKKKIALGVKNLATWAHELTHAADDILGTINKVKGQDVENEVVAELGGAILLEIMGYHVDSDLGGAWHYINSYCGKDKDKTIKTCMRLLDRICTCVDLIIHTATNDIDTKKAA